MPGLDGYVTSTPGTNNNRFTQAAFRAPDHSQTVSSVVGLTFEIFLVSETQGDAVAVAAGAFADLGDSGAEAGHTASVHTELTIGTVAWREQDRTWELFYLYY